MGATKQLSTREISGRFFQRVEEVSAALWLDRVANTFTSDQPIEKYKFMGRSAAMREWIGSRSASEPKVYEIQAENKKYENGADFAEEDLERDKTGQIAIRIRDLGANAAVLPQRVISDLLIANGNAYDGVALFGTHVAGPVITNALTDSSVAVATAPTSAEMTSGILAAMTAIWGALDDQGQPMNEFARDFTVMVPTLYATATFAALKNDFTSAGVSNNLRSVQDGAGLTIRPVVNPRLTTPTSTGVFYVFRSDADVRPFIWQEETPIMFDALREGSDYTYNTGRHKFGSKQRAVGVNGEFAMAARMTFS